MIEPMEELDWEKEVDKALAEHYLDWQIQRGVDAEFKDFYEPKLNGDPIHDYRVMKGEI